MLDFPRPAVMPEIGYCIQCLGLRVPSSMTTVMLSFFKDLFVCMCFLLNHCWYFFFFMWYCGSYLQQLPFPLPPSHPETLPCSMIHSFPSEMMPSQESHLSCCSLSNPLSSDSPVARALICQVTETPHHIYPFREGLSLSGDEHRLIKSMSHWH